MWGPSLSDPSSLPKISSYLAPPLRLLQKKVSCFHASRSSSQGRESCGTFGRLREEGGQQRAAEGGSSYVLVVWGRGGGEGTYTWFQWSLGGRGGGRGGGGGGIFPPSFLVKVCVSFRSSPPRHSQPTTTLCRPPPLSSETISFPFSFPPTACVCM